MARVPGQGGLRAAIDVRHRSARPVRPDRDDGLHPRAGDRAARTAPRPRIKASAAELGFAFDRHARAQRDPGAVLRCRRTRRSCGWCSRAAAPIALELRRHAAARLPDPASCAVLPLPVDAGDWRLRHKTSDRGFYEAGAGARHAPPAPTRRCSCATTGWSPRAASPTFSSSATASLLTPPARLGLLPGVLRRSLIDARPRGGGRAARSTISPTASSSAMRCAG